MGRTVRVKYLYAPTYWSEDEFALALNAFERLGEGDRICLAESIDEASKQIERESVLVVSTVELFENIEELFAALVVLQKRQILLQTLAEPWLNLAIRDHAYCLNQLQRALKSTKKEEQWSKNKP